MKIMVMSLFEKQHLLAIPEMNNVSEKKSELFIQNSNNDLSKKS